MLMKARFDLIAEVEGGIIIVDLKKVGQDDERSFVMSCADLHYDVQNAVYRHGAAEALSVPLDTVRFIHAAIPDKPPHCIDWRQMGHRTMRTGEENMRKAINKYTTAKATGEWTTIQAVELPEWYLSR